MRQWIVAVLMLGGLLALRLFLPDRTLWWIAGTGAAILMYFFLTLQPRRRRWDPKDHL